MNEPQPCGECENGYVFEPPLQDGGLGLCRPCQQCKQNWQRYWNLKGDE